MRKICCLLFAVFILCISASCYQRKETRISQPVIMPAIQSPEDIDDYIGEKGYEILESKGKTEEYTLDKKRVYNNWQIWAVQYPEPDHYLGKEISIYSYEVTYKNGQLVPYGTKGGVRLDVVEYNVDGTIKAVYDLKTGKAGLTTSRIQEILNHLPNNAPVYEIRPK